MGSSGVPDVLRGREVSVRALVPIWAGARRHGLRVATLAEGLPYTLAQLEDPAARISWKAFATILENLGSALPDEDLVNIGVSAFATPVVRTLLLPGRLLFPLPAVYRWGAGPDGPMAQTFAVHDLDVTSLGRSSIRIEAVMKPGYESIREHWIITQGMFRGVARAFGRELAEVTFTPTPSGARFELRIEEKASLRARVRRGTTWLSAARETAEQLRRANEELHGRYLALEREAASRARAEAELRALNDDLERRVAERTTALEHANRELAAANRELAMFTASAAHDLRSPLRAINGFANAILEDHGDRLDDDVKAQLGRVVAGAIRMAALIDALLALAGMTRVELKRRRLDLSAMADAALAQLRRSDPSRLVEVAIEPGLEVDGDPSLVQALLDNLLANAWKFSRDRMPARIEVARTSTSPVDVFRVHDNGVGFDMKHADKLFQAFWRLHSTREFEGHGVGLALAERVVLRHGGRIWAEADGEGATFSFTLAPDA